MNSEIPTLKKNSILCPYTTPNFTHRHVKWEFVIFEQGLCVNTVNDLQYDSVSCGDIFLLGPMHLHAIRFLSEPHRHWDLYLSDAELKKQCDCLNEKLYEYACNKEKPLHFKLDPQQMTPLINEFEGLYILNSLKNPNETDAVSSISAIGRGIAGFLLAKYIESTLMRQIHPPLWFREILQNLRRPEIFSQRLNEIISVYNYSYPQFTRIFKKYTGKKMIDYVTELRMDYAAELLMTTDKTELEISSLVGYDSFCFFINRFKQKFGTTPRKYRHKIFHPDNNPADL